ncbi:MAG: hypothetical protein KFBDDELM_00183 [Candidatus Argoarchaeum ethanivorans]|uniref:Uncharacterized protein n=1 Tax=Candidatus Argoarchaeum ethanivorans TaxID=2608793 RepID=A0A811T4T2_9EURY|nr:MAG: hypothetical protein KFBDDELM_00183 [Candidatus Argoarchaeum ethanivorans]
MNILNEWWNSRAVYQKVLIIGVVDLLLLVVTFFCEKKVFFYLILINVIILIDGIPLWYFTKLYKQPISSEEYYLKNIDANYMYMDENLLNKLFEIRLSNRGQFIFTYLFLIVTFALTIAFNHEARNFFNRTNIGVSGSIILTVACFIGILVFVFATFGIDRSTLKELETLFEAKKKLRQLKEGNILSPTQETPTTNEGTNEHENNKAV